MNNLNNLINEWEHILPMWMVKMKPTDDVGIERRIRCIKKMVDKYEPKQDYTTFLDKLQNYIENEIVLENMNMCCDKPDIRFDKTYHTCINCGISRLDNFEIETPNVYLNTQFHLSTIMSGGSGKHNKLKRFHQWGNHNYKETTLMKTLCLFETICKEFGIGERILGRAKFLYKTIYIDNKISSRSNIKKAMYVYCIYESCKENNFEIDLEYLLTYSNIKTEHYSKCLKKIEKYLNIKNEDNTIFIDTKLKKKYEICIKKKLNVDKIELITLYNKYKEYNTTKQINNNSIILGVIYLLIKDKVNLKRFIKIFKTTKITLKKFFDLIEMKISGINC